MVNYGPVFCIGLFIVSTVIECCYMVVEVKSTEMYGDEGKNIPRYMGLLWFIGTSWLASLEEPIDRWFCNSFLQFTVTVL